MATIFGVSFSPRAKLTAPALIKWSTSWAANFRVPPDGGEGSPPLLPAGDGWTSEPAGARGKEVPTAAIAPERWDMIP